MSKIIDFHIKNGYYVKIKSLDPLNGCLVEFPRNIFRNINQINQTYVLNINPYSIDLCISDENKKVLAKNNVNATCHNIRMLVIEDIVLTAWKKGFPQKLIVTEKNKKILDLLKIEQSNEERRIEIELYEIVKKLLSGESIDDSKIEGCDQVIKVFEKGGLLL